MGVSSNGNRNRAFRSSGTRVRVPTLPPTTMIHPIPLYFKSVMCRMSLTYVHGLISTLLPLVLRNVTFSGLFHSSYNGLGIGQAAPRFSWYDTDTVNSFASFFQVGISKWIWFIRYLTLSKYMLSTWIQNVNILYLSRYRYGTRPATKPCTSVMLRVSWHKEDRQQYVQSEKPNWSWLLLGYQSRW